MPETPQLLAFIAAGLLLNLTPGPDVLYIVTQATRRGLRAGLVAALGITAGCCVHIVAAAAGVSALVAASSTAFAVLKWVGAAYLLYVGLSMLLVRRKLEATARTVAARSPAVPAADADAGLWVVFRRGFWTNALNPKVALFFLAFVPQFIAHGAAHPSLAFLALGLLFNVNALFVNAGWAWATAAMAQRLGAVRRGMRWLDRAAGAMFIGFGLKLALAERQ